MRTCARGHIFVVPCPPAARLDSLRYVGQTRGQTAHPSLPLSTVTREGGRVNRGIPFHGVYLGKKGAPPIPAIPGNVIKFHSTSSLPPPFPPVYTIYLARAPILVNAFSSKLYAYVELRSNKLYRFHGIESMFERGIRLKKGKC